MTETDGVLGILSLSAQRSVSARTQRVIPDGSNSSTRSDPAWRAFEISPELVQRTMRSLPSLISIMESPLPCKAGPDVNRHGERGRFSFVSRVTHGAALAQATEGIEKF